jgi:hypothetical protein
MTITAKCKVEMGNIRLPRNVNIPDGTQVIINIRPILNKKDKQKIVEELSGAWSNDPTIDPIFEKIECDRHEYFGRGSDFE